MSTNGKTGQRGGMVTQESVSAAADALEQSGQTVSVRKVIAALGGGSPNAVLPFVQAWKDARPVVKPADIALDPRLIQVLAEQITIEVTRTRRDALQEADAIKDDALAVAEAGKLAEERVEQLTAELEETRAELQQHVGRLAGLHEEMDALKGTTAAEVAKARTDMQQEREAAEKLRQTLARAELRLESLPTVEQELRDVRAQLQAETAARAESEKAAAVATAQAQAAIARAEAAETAQKQVAETARSEAQEARAELADVRSQLRGKTDEVGALLRQVADGQKKELEKQAKLQEEGGKQPKTQGGENGSA